MSRRIGRARRRKALRRLCKAQRGRCFYCHEPMRPPSWRPGPGERSPADMATIDHRVPRAAGGTNHDDNLVAACYRCNQRKSQADARPGATRAPAAGIGSRTT